MIRLGTPRPAWTLAVLAGLFVPAIAQAPAAPLRLRLSDGYQVGWRMETVRVDEGDVPGAVDVGGGKKELRLAEAMPVGLTVQSGAGRTAVLSRGPLEVRGRKVGRAKLTDLRLSPTGQMAGDAMGRPFAPLMVVLPDRPARVGLKWTSTFWGPTPTPAGVPATYTVKALRNVAGQRVAEVTMAIKWEQGTRVTGSGTFLIRLADGYVDKADVRLRIEFLRAGSATDRRLTVSSRSRVTSTLRRTR